MRTLMKSIGILSLAATSVVSADSPSPRTARVAPAPMAKPAAAPTVEALVAAGHALTFDLGKRIAPNDNAVFSPASIHIALGMTFAGARGSTADEMARVLHYDRAGGSAGVHALFKTLGSSLARLEHKDQSFHIVNRLFGKEKYNWSNEYLALTDKNYGASLEPVNFGDSEKTRLHINEWVAEHTNKKIKDLLPPRSLTADTRMVLTNAVYFKGAWLNQFEGSATRDDRFFARGNGAVKVPTMRQTARFGFGGNASAQIVELPYSHGDLAMDVIVPRTKDGLASLEAKLDGPALIKLLDSMKSTTLELALPRFKVRTSVEMKKLFEQLGLRQPFKQSADFSGMVKKVTESLWIDSIFHQGFVDVDEKGTEAAAATAIVMTGESAAMPATPTPFHVDRPFVWLIRDVKTGAILFYGRVVDPR